MSGPKPIGRKWSDWPDLHAVLPASLSCGDDRECSAHPARTARRIAILCVVVAGLLMTAMLLMNMR